MSGNSKPRTEVKHDLMKSQKMLMSLNFPPQGAGKGFDPPTKVPMPETPVFGSGPTWGTTFTKVILLRMAEAVYCF